MQSTRGFLLDSVALLALLLRTCIAINPRAVSRCVCFALLLSMASPSWGQVTQNSVNGAGNSSGLGAQVAENADERAAVTPDELERLAADAAADRAARKEQTLKGDRPRELSFFQLLIDGGPLIIPLVLISVLVLTVSLERLINLRIGRILPRKLRRGLLEASEQRFPLDPQELYQMGLRYPSVASRVLESMLKKVGRPIPELEAAVQDSCQREADRLYGTVRWLTAAAAIAPLLGLLGTVWGMILAFFETTQPGLGMNRTQQLAQGISIAFVNTLAGLAIAIPAAAFSHFFEGRIVKLMGLVQELVQSLIPRLERFEGVTRYDLELSGLVPRRDTEHTHSTPSQAFSPSGTLLTRLDDEAAANNAARVRETPRAPTAPSVPRTSRGR